ncbi:hypothetical protein [Peribacillus deserti]|uniref:Lipoprotein n=1 Tax=Peribacillus deserti TaxID=673318 RepID=A0A2N5M1C1_9BACI|nr:hypothetical protein [Peribacillus deserti]PLT28184.1 hypothetical protein CUU66_19775 [Peribacillus deserti]
MKITHGISAFTITSALILAGCGAKETTDKKEETVVQASDVIKDKEVVHTKEKEVIHTKEEKLAELSSTYKEMGKYFAEWQLPKDGILPKDDPQWNETEPLDGSDPHEAFVYYDNGYGFDKRTGYNFVIAYDTDDEGNGKPKPPTPDQRVGVIMAIIDEMAQDGDHVLDSDPMYIKDANGKKILNQTFMENLKADINNSIDNLSKVRDFAQKDHAEPLEAWANETISFFLGANKTVNIKDGWQLYSKGMDNIEQLNKTIEMARS